ncbi:MAG: ATP-binding cassette domain-containing protein, partial [Candidatus Heimdallarchaeaceae archaeon]
IGPNGAGKTTLLKCISSLLIPSEGEIHLNGDKVSPKNLAIRNKIGFLPEDSGLYDRLSAKEFLHVMAGMSGISKEVRGDKVRDVVEYIGIDFPPSKIVKYLSTGQRRLLLLASIILHEPDIIILDESLSGLDPINRERISEIMRKLAMENIVLFSSHILSDIWRLCEKIFVLNDGNLIVEDNPESILSRMTDDSFFVTSKINIEKVKDYLEKNTLVQEVSIQGERIIFRLKDFSKAKQLVGEMLEKFEIVSFGPNIPDLDQIFTRLVDAS